MKTIHTFIFLFIILFSAEAKKVDLKLKLETGKEYRQKMVSESNIIQEISGQKMDMVMSITGEMLFKVNDYQNGVYDMDVNYERLAMSIKMPQMTMEFSSEKEDENDVLSKILASMKGKVFNIKMTDKGKVTEVNNIETIYESAFDNLPQITEQQIAQIREQIARAYGKDAFKGSIEMAIAVFPDKKVKKGESWEVDTELKSGMQADVTTTYTLVEIHPDYFLIKGDSKIVTADKDAYVKMNGMPMRYDLSGTMASVIRIGSDTGWIVEAEIKQDIGGDAYIKENEKLPDGMVIPMVMKTTMTVTD